MLLIHPPVSKPAEPPGGIAKLAGALKAHGLPCRLLDMNLEAMLSLLENPVERPDAWTRRAVKDAARNTAALRSAETYRSRDRYVRAVMDLNRVVEIAADAKGVTAGLADYQDRNLSPLRSKDLLEAAAHPEKNLFHPYFSKRLPVAIEEAGRMIVGFSLNYLSQALCTFSMIGFIRREFPEVKIVLGGGLITSWMRRPGWKDHFAGLVDHVVAGPGEPALLSLLGALQVKSEHHKPDLASLPVADYLSPGVVLPYSASSGCYWSKCSFCPETTEGAPYTNIPPSTVTAHLEGLVRETRPALVHFLDNAMSPALLQALAAGATGVPWYGFARIDDHLADPGFCRALKQAGCAMLKLGLESGDQDVLDRMRKNIDLETASRVLANLRSAGIATYVYLLFGTPEETQEGARRTLEFAARHSETITFLNLAIFNLPVGSSGEAEQHYEGDLSLYAGFSHPRGWGRKQVRHFLDREFRRHPAIMPILRNDPPVFTSNHAAFFPERRNDAVV